MTAKHRQPRSRRQHDGWTGRLREPKLRGARAGTLGTLVGRVQQLLTRRASGRFQAKDEGHHTGPEQRQAVHITRFHGYRSALFDFSFVTGLCGSDSKGALSVDRFPTAL